MDINTRREGAKGWSKTPFSGNLWQGQGQWAQTGIEGSVWTSRNIHYSEGDQAWAQIPREVVESHFLGIIKSHLDTVLGDCFKVALPTCAVGLDKVTPRWPFQSQPFCDTVILWKARSLQWGWDVTFCAGAHGIQLTFLCCKNYLQPLLQIQDNVLLCLRHERERLDLHCIQWEVIFAIIASRVRVL